MFAPRGTLWNILQRVVPSPSLSASEIAVRLKNAAKGGAWCIFVPFLACDEKSFLEEFSWLKPGWWPVDRLIMERSTMLLIEKSTISTGPWLPVCFLYVYQAGYTIIYPIESHWITIESHWITIESHWITIESHWITIESHWITIESHWITIESHWITIKSH